MTSNHPKPTPPPTSPSADRIYGPPAPTAPDPIPDTLGHIDAALALLAAADLHATHTMGYRALDDHQMAGRFAEQQRACMKRAELLVAIAQAEALDHIAQRLDRIALGL